jgi:HSP20 family molecular chaperone IbpA
MVSLDHSTFKNGVLELTLPKVEAPKGKSVKIERG